MLNCRRLVTSYIYGLIKNLFTTDNSVVCWKSIIVHCHFHWHMYYGCSMVFRIFRWNTSTIDGTSNYGFNKDISCYVCADCCNKLKWNDYEDEVGLVVFYSHIKVMSVQLLFFEIGTWNQRNFYIYRWIKSISLECVNCAAISSYSQLLSILRTNKIISFVK